MDILPRLLLMAAVTGGGLGLLFWIILKGKCRFCKGLGYCFYDASVWGEPTFTPLNDWSNGILIHSPGYCCNHCPKGVDLFQKVHGKSP